MTTEGATVIQQTRVLAGLPCVVTGTLETADVVVVLLHGFNMSPSQLAPFAHSLGIEGAFVLPQGLQQVGPQGWAWWQVDCEQRRLELACGPRDLSLHIPEGLESARNLLTELLAAVSALSRSSSVVLAGFSQGAMLACDHAILAGSSLSGLILMSASRIAMPQWQARLGNLKGLPVLVSHGRQDMDLSFDAGTALRDTLVEAGALVTWVPFDQGHEIPLTVWRQVRRFVRSLTKPARPPMFSCASSHGDRHLS